MAERERIVRLIDPDQCFTCRFTGLAVVRVGLEYQQILHCNRLDCDNHHNNGDNAPMPKRVDITKLPTFRE